MTIIGIDPGTARLGYGVVKKTKGKKNKLKVIDYGCIETSPNLSDAERLKKINNELNKLIQNAVYRHSPPSMRGRRLKVYFATQGEGIPPAFIIFVNNPKLAHFGYRRYLENQIREVFAFKGTPITLVFRTSRDESQLKR